MSAKNWEIKEGHAFDLLSKMPDESVQMCATSPPYWGLRDYGDGGQRWPAVSYSPMAGLPLLKVPAQTAALGLEPDPFVYIGHLVALFREVRRVLKDDGVLFINLGDSYSSGGSGLKAKDLCGIPWRAAMALQADGWWLRSDVIWHKPNPMPSSIKDRPTPSHEHIFILAKSARYFWDSDAVKVEASSGVQARNAAGIPTGDACAERGIGRHRAAKTAGCPDGRRNIRTVWTMPTSAFPGSHFAVWPPALAERCIKAGSRRGDVVLDPFSGSGTTGMCARRLDRGYIGLEQSAKYAEMSRRRIEGDSPLFNRPPTC